MFNSKNIRKIIVIVLATIMLLFIAKRVIPFFYSGAYPFSETYKLELQDSLLIKQILEFKNNNPTYITPKQCELMDHYDKSYKDLFIIYFYYKKENKIIRTWVSRLDNNTSNVGIVSINTGLEIGHWKTINNEIGTDESNKEILIFENRILKQLNIPFKKE